MAVMRSFDPKSGTQQDGTDAAVERVLRALISVEPEPGLETRILSRVRHGQANRKQLLWDAVRVLRVSAALALAATLALCGYGVLRKGRPAPERLAGQTGVFVTPGGTPRAALRADPLRPQAPTRLMRAGRMLRDAHQPASAASDDAGRVGLPVSQEAAASNMPAPAMPLTEQERLLLRYTHRRDPQEVATLSPAGSMRHEQADRAAYDQFFAEPPLPPPPPETPTGDPEWLPAIR